MNRTWQNLYTDKKRMESQPAAMYRTLTERKVRGRHQQSRGLKQENLNQSIYALTGKTE